MKTANLSISYRARVSGTIIRATKADLEQLRSDIIAALRDTETNLLKAFFAHQEHSDVRFRKMTADVSNINSAAELRLNNLEKRIIKLEKHFLMGPQ
jgi:hypothetical protein